MDVVSSISSSVGILRAVIDLGVAIHDSVQQVKSFKAQSKRLGRRIDVITRPVEILLKDVDATKEAGRQKILADSSPSASTSASATEEIALEKQRGSREDDGLNDPPRSLKELEACMKQVAEFLKELSSVKFSKKWLHRTSIEGKFKYFNEELTTLQQSLSLFLQVKFGKSFPEELTNQINETFNQHNMKEENMTDFKEDLADLIEDMDKMKLSLGNINETTQETNMLVKEYKNELDSLKQQLSQTTHIKDESDGASAQPRDGLNSGVSGASDARAETHDQETEQNESTELTSLRAENSGVQTEDADKAGYYNWLETEKDRILLELAEKVAGSCNIRKLGFGLQDSAGLCLRENDIVKLEYSDPRSLDNQFYKMFQLHGSRTSMESVFPSLVSGLIAANQNDKADWLRKRAKIPIIVRQEGSNEVRPQEESASATRRRSEPEATLTVALASGQPENNPGRENQLRPQEESASATRRRSEPEATLTVALTSGQPENNPDRENQHSTTHRQGGRSKGSEFYDIYLFHSGGDENKTHLKRIKKFFHDMQWKVMDHQERGLGCPKFQQIGQYLRTASHVIILLSEADCREYIGREVLLAVEMAIDMALEDGDMRNKVIPIRCCKTESVPDNLRSWDGMDIDDENFEIKLQNTVKIDIRQEKEKQAISK